MAQSARKLENDVRTENVQNRVKINAHILFKNTTVLRHFYLVMSRTLSQVHHLRYCMCRTAEATDHFPLWKGGRKQITQ